MATPDDELGGYVIPPEVVDSLQKWWAAGSPPFRFTSRLPFDLNNPYAELLDKPNPPLPAPRIVQHPLTGEKMTNEEFINRIDDRWRVVLKGPMPANDDEMQELVRVMQEKLAERERALLTSLMLYGQAYIDTTTGQVLTYANSANSYTSIAVIAEHPQKPQHYHWRSRRKPRRLPHCRPAKGGKRQVPR